ncbi:MAG TPA: DUF2971 domain-containing protein [Arenimonas sp.]|nr:DUF2971 domain-containing protein [Arenimonas sp.]
MNDERLPLHGKTLPAIDWRRSGRRIHLDPTADDLAQYQVYRYCSLPEALQLFGRGQWSFAHPTTWPDKYEHHLSRELFGAQGPYAGTQVHVKCLSVEYASHALWRTYAGPIGVLRIGIALQDLVAMLAAAKLPAGSQLYITRVRYLDERNLQREVAKLVKAGTSDIDATMRALALKRAGFAYENELRICLATPGAGTPDPIRIVSGLKAARVKSVQIDPYLPPWQAEEIRRVLVQHVGDGARVVQSRFDADVD